jgi:hypothetical protein
VQDSDFFIIRSAAGGHRVAAEHISNNVIFYGAINEGIIKFFKRSLQSAGAF